MLFCPGLVLTSLSCCIDYKVSNPSATPTPHPV
ncbi:hypothetical protein KP509_11G091200 [Ceratopteris richardii]|uniref:Uncharacterized protein n=1 Tax=Ceratopteris richardii TaxID=49495 RepID=A0A8T2TUY1_CERRI|nr:hypothetical protein KP509_11G091200 [Ceratopteris richardii]